MSFSTITFWPWILSLSDVLYITFSWTFVNIVKTSEKSCVNWANSKSNHISFPNLYTFLIHIVIKRNRFYKSITSTKLITSLKSTIKLYRFQKNGLFGLWLSSTLISFDDKPPWYEMWRNMWRMMYKILLSLVSLNNNILTIHLSECTPISECPYQLKPIN